MRDYGDVYVRTAKWKLSLWTSIPTKNTLDSLIMVSSWIVVYLDCRPIHVFQAGDLLILSININFFTASCMIAADVELCPAASSTHEKDWKATNTTLVYPREHSEVKRLRAEAIAKFGGTFG